MGVMPCRKESCDEILCGHQVGGWSICPGCLRELEGAAAAWPERMGREEMLDRISEWLDAPKQGVKQDRDPLLRSLIRGPGYGGEEGR